MKAKTFKLTILVTMLALPFMMNAQDGDKRSKEILKQVADKTRGYETIGVEFNYKMDNNEADIHDSYSGSLTIRGDMYRLSIGGQTVICNGKTIWTYIADAEEVQIHSVEDNDQSITPSTLLTSYHEDFRSKLIREGVENGVPAYVIDLIPLEGKSFYKVRVIIHKQKMHITSFAIYERNGSTFTYDITSFEPNISAPAESFSFRKSEFPDADIIDMR